MTHPVDILPSANKELAQLPREARVWIDGAIASLTQNPVPPTAKPVLANYEGLFRLRVGRYRLVYRWAEGRLTIVMISAARHADGYL